MTISLFRVLCVLEFKKKKIAIMNKNMSHSLSLKSSETEPHDYSIFTIRTLMF